MIKSRVAYRGLLLAALAGLSGCGNSVVQPTGSQSGENTIRNHYDNATGSAFGDSGSLFNFGRNSGSSDNSALAVNAYLWRGSLETLKFMPLASADPFGGVIITDWWTPASSPSERFKATAYILGKQLRADGVRISLFRQVQQNGQWVDAPVDPSKVSELEDRVLARARDLRAQAASAQ